MKDIFTLIGLCGYGVVYFALIPIMPIQIYHLRHLSNLWAEREFDLHISV